MKSMTCKQLGGSCDKVFRAETFDEIAEMSKQHGMEMYKIQDAAHLVAMDEMKKMMGSPDAMKQWMADRMAEFAALPED